MSRQDHCDEHATSLESQVPRRSIVWKFALFVGFVVAASVSFVGWVAYRSAESLLRARIHQQLKVIAADRGEMLNSFVQRQHDFIALIASRSRLRQLMREHLDKKLSDEQFQELVHPILSDLRRSVSTIQSVTLLDLQGVVTASTNADEIGQDLASNTAFQRAKTASHLSIPHQTAGRSHLHLAAPAVDAEDQNVGVIMVTLDAKFLVDLLQRPAELGKSGEVLVGTLNEFDVQFLLPSISDGSQRISTQLAPTFAMSIADRETGFGSTLFNGEEVLAAWRPIDYQPREFQPWGMLVKVPMSEAYAPITSLKRKLTGIVFGCVVAGALASYWLALRLARPILKVAAVASEVATGNLRARMSPVTDDEIGTLSAAFNHMTRELEASHAELEDRIAARTQALEQANHELVIAKDEALAASRAKSLFVANMSHEIRTPMNAILGLTDLVLDSEISTTQREYLRIVHESGESLLTLINDILDFSKIEAGKFDLDLGPFRMRERLGDAVKSLALRAHSKGIELALHIHPEVPDVVVGDSGRLRQVLINLVGNAIKFTDHGQVVVDVVCEEKTDERARLHFQVIDTGIGIPADKLSAIFKPFEQVDMSKSRKFGGTGLGLTISARLLELMGGRIWAESQLDQGSQFHFVVEFPVSREEVPESTRHSIAALRNLRALVIDDNATNRLILDEILTGWNIQATLANSALQGLDAILMAHEAGQPYHIVITDLHMPEHDGFHFIDWVRARPEVAATPILMLSSGIDSPNWTRCKQLNVQHLLKPAKESELLDAVTLAVGMASVDERASTPKLSGLQIEPQRILLAEDSLVNQKLAMALLQKQGHEVTVATTGTEVLKVLRERRFDVVLMDVQMPEMDGLEATRIIRSGELGTREHLPIVAMTAHAMAGDREQCIAAGMDEYISKPIRLETILEALRRVLHVADASPTDSRASSVEIHVVDLQAALRPIGGDRRAYSEIARAFLEEFPMQLLRAKSAIAADDFKARREAAHTLKAGLRTIGAASASELALHLEFAESSASREDIDQLVLQLEQACEQIKHQLLEWLRGAV